MKTFPAQDVLYKKGIFFLILIGIYAHQFIEW